MTYYFDMDGTLADFHGAYTSHADACRYDFIRNLAPFTANVETMRKAIADGHNCYILSKAANEDAKHGHEAEVGRSQKSSKRTPDQKLDSADEHAPARRPHHADDRFP